MKINYLFRIISKGTFLHSLFRNIFSVSVKSIEYQRILRMKFKDYDRDLLGIFIRQYGHFVEKATKNNFTQNRGNEKYLQLKKALAIWRKRNYPLIPDIQWAERMGEKYEHWVSNKTAIVPPSKERQLSSDIFTVIKERRSVRFWKAQNVEVGKIEAIIEAGTWAPSACNRQAWRFIIVFNKIENLKKGEANNESMLRKAPVKIYVIIDERLHPDIFAPYLDAAACVQNMILAAHALELGTCWLYGQGLVSAKKLRQELALKSYEKICSVILLGYPDEEAEPPLRSRTQDIIKYIRR